MMLFLGSRRSALFSWMIGFGCLLRLSAEPVPLVSQTNEVLRIAAANLTSGTSQRYEVPGIRIFQGLKPDVVAIQEFLYSGSLRAFVDTAFGTNYHFYQEQNTLPNGVISRWPILSSGSFVQPQMPNRGFAWARIDIPGTNDLYVVSVHLKASSSEQARRQEEVTSLINSVRTQFPTNAWVVVAGDFNLSSTSEAAYSTMTKSFSDRPVPVDQAGDPDTNANRNERYDYVFSSFNLTNCLVPTILGSRTHQNGLVFDSRVYSPLGEVSPVLIGDSGVAGMQHMAVVRTYRVPYLITNLVDRPVLNVSPDGVLQWNASTGLTYRIQATTNLSSPAWKDVSTVTGSTPRYTNALQGAEVYFRVVHP